MKEHVLLAMKYLNDNSSVTTQELSGNYRAAAATYAADDAVYTAYAYAIAAAVYAYAIAIVDIKYTENKVDRYFGYTKENKQDYIDEITKNKGE